MSRRRVSLACFASALMLLVSPCLSDLIYSSFPYSTGGGWGYCGPNNIYIGIDVDQAVRFWVPAGSDYTLDAVVLALYNQSRNPETHVYFMTNVDTLPDIVIDTAITSAPSPMDTMLVVFSPPIVMAAGESYWIACSTPGDGYNSWLRSVGTWGRRAESQEGGPWFSEINIVGGLKVYATPDLTGLSDSQTPAPVVLSQNHPNPFNPHTIIGYRLEMPADVTLSIYDISGHLIRVLCDAVPREAGSHEAPWHGRDNLGRPAASGTYFYRLTAGAYTETKRMVLLK